MQVNDADSQLYSKKEDNYTLTLGVLEKLKGLEKTLGDDFEVLLINDKFEGRQIPEKAIRNATDNMTQLSLMTKITTHFALGN